jgi:hypothetical protein
VRTLFGALQAQGNPSKIFYVTHKCRLEGHLVRRPRVGQASGLSFFIYHERRGPEELRRMRGYGLTSVFRVERQAGGLSHLSEQY